MKKTALLMSLVALFLFSACDSNSYRIKGTVTDPTISDSTKVYLDRYNKTMICLDSTYVIDGKFELKGNVDSVETLYLVFGDNLRKIANLILEPGKISIKVDSNFNYMVTGTEQNDILTGFSVKEKELSKRAEKVVKAYRSAQGKAKDSLLAVLQGFEKEYTKLSYDYSLKHVNSIAGTRIFLGTNYGYSIAQKDSILSKMNEKTKENPDIKALLKQVESLRKTAVGQPFTDFEMKNLKGQNVKLSDFVGKTDYLLVDFWASWCGPCLRSLPELKKFYKEHKGTKFNIVGVSLDSKEDAWKAAIKKHKLGWNHMSDLKGWQSLGASLYSVRGIPATVLIDKKGTIVGRNMPLNEINKLLAK